MADILTVLWDHSVAVSSLFQIVYAESRRVYSPANLSCKSVDDLLLRFPECWLDGRKKISLYLLYVALSYVAEEPRVAQRNDEEEQETQRE